MWVLGGAECYIAYYLGARCLLTMSGGPSSQPTVITRFLLLSCVAKWVEGFIIALPKC